MDGKYHLHASKKNSTDFKQIYANLALSTVTQISLQITLTCTRY